MDMLLLRYVVYSFAALGEILGLGKEQFLLEETRLTMFLLELQGHKKSEITEFLTAKKF